MVKKFQLKISNKMLISDITMLRRIIPTVISDEHFERYSSSLYNAELWFRRDIVGDELMSIINKLSIGDELYRLAQACVAYKAYLAAIPTLDVVETADGFAVVDDSQLSPASTARVKNLTAQIKANLDEAIENIQAWLEGSSEYLEQWQNCEGCTLLSDTLLPSLSLYKRYGAFTGSRLEYKNQRSVLISMQIQSIAPVISSTYLNFLVKGEDLSDADKKILSLLRFALTNLFSKNSDQANTFLMLAREYMLENIDSFPIYAESENYARLSFLKDSEKVSEGIYTLL